MAMKLFGLEINLFGHVFTLLSVIFYFALMSLTCFVLGRLFE